MARVPFGIIILAVLNFLTGILLLVGETLFPTFSGFILSEIFSGIQYGFLIIALVYIILGLGLFSLAGWAWYADIIFAIFNLIVILWNILVGGSIPWITLILNVIIVLYLNERGIKSKFRV
jgi:uncharacterized membrane protein (DUF2068 family)